MVFINNMERTIGNYNILLKLDGNVEVNGNFYGHVKDLQYSKEYNNKRGCEYEDFRYLVLSPRFTITVNIYVDSYFMELQVKNDAYTIFSLSLTKNKSSEINL
mgnify:CR=1 FL=1